MTRVRGQFWEWYIVNILSPNIGSWEVDMRWQIVWADIVRDKDPDPEVGEKLHKKEANVYF